MLILSFIKNAVEVVHRNYFSKMSFTTFEEYMGNLTTKPHSPVCVNKKMHCSHYKEWEQCMYIIHLQEEALIPHPYLPLHHAQQLCMMKMQFRKKHGFYLRCRLVLLDFLLNIV